MTQQTKVVRVTPAMAREWLLRNTDNRPLSAGTAEGYLAAMQRGEWRLTHQGIAFDEDGVVLDGQHRLEALAQMPEEFGIEMNVTKGVPRGDAWHAIDRGAARTPAEVLRVSNGLASVARFMAVLDEYRGAIVTPQLMLPYLKACSPHYEMLMGYAPTSSKTWSSAAVKTAAILRMLDGGESDYILISYHALVHADFDDMSPIVKALYRQQTRTAIVRGSIDMCARAFRAFDHTKARLNTVQLSDIGGFYKDARRIIREKALGQKSAASTRPAAKKVNAANSKAIA